MTPMRSNYGESNHPARVSRSAFARIRTLPISRSPFDLISSHRRITTIRMALWWAVAVTLVWSALLMTAMSASAQSFQIFVPMVSTEGSGPGGSGEEPVACGLNGEEQAVAEMMMANSGQKRKNPTCDPILAQVARARARDMALRGYFSHTNPDGDGPNLLVREAGYPLPGWYASNQDSNNIESIGAGYPSADAAWQAWLNSSSHRVHVLGTQSFYADQDAFGIGYYFNPNSQYQHYWVFLSAPIAESE